jgi:dienelactone hydrolase
VKVPVLVLIGRKDLQIDANADGVPLQQAATGMPNVTFAFPPNANHVFKEDLRTAAELTAAPGTGYNEPGTRLDPESLNTILYWLREVFR